MQSGSRQHRGEAGGGGNGFPPLLATDGRIHKGDCDMRTGAIFARGSCRALKWMALLGMVFGLGVGTASAQVTVSLASDEVPEGDRITINVSAMIDLPQDADGTADITVNVTPGAPSGTLAAGRAPAVAEDVSGGFAATPIVLDVPAAATGATSTVHRILTATDTITLIRDDDAEVEVLALTVELTANGNLATDGSALALVAGDNSFTVTITERDTQVYTWDPPAPKLKEGGTVDVELTAEPSPSQLNPVVDLVLDPSVGYELSVNTVTFSATAGTPADSVGDTVTITITALENDGNRVDDTLMLRALADGTLRDVNTPLSITVEDSHKLPTVTAKITDEDGTEVTSVAEGDEVMLQFEADKAPSEDVTITLTRASSSEAGTDDYELSAAKATIAANSTTSEKLTLMAEADADVMDEMLVLTGAVTGVAANGAAGTPVTVELTIEDMTQRQVFVLTADTDPSGDAMGAIYGAMNAAKGSDGKLNPGDEFQVAKSMLFGTATGFEARVSASSSTSAASVNDGGGDITVTLDSQGSAMITVTGSAIPMGSGFQARQISASVAEIKFEVMVDAAPAPSVVAKSNDDVLAAYWEARNAVAGSDGLWTSADGPVTIALSALFDNLPASPAASSTSSEPSSVLASTTASALVLSPVAVGESTITVTVGGATVTFMALVDDPNWDLRGRITSISIDDAEERTIDGKKRMFVTEGELSRVSVTVEWTNQQLTALWVGHTAANPPPPAEVSVYGQGWWDPDFNEWASVAEMSENPGGGVFGGDDVVLASNLIEVPIPDKPRRNVNSVFDKDSKTGWTSVSLPRDVDAEEEAFHIRLWSDASRHFRVNLDTSKERTDLIHIIEDIDTQGVTLKVDKARDTVFDVIASGDNAEFAVYEGTDGVRFIAEAKPPREDLPLDVRYDLTDVNGQSVSSQLYTINRSIGTILADPEATHEATVNLAANDRDRSDENLQMHVEVVSYSLDTGAFDDIKSDSVEFKVVDRHKLPPVTANPVMGSVAEGESEVITFTIDRNPKTTVAHNDEKNEYTQEALTITLTGSGPAPEHYRMPGSVAVPEHPSTATSRLQTVKVTVEATNNDDVGEMQLMINATVTGDKKTNESREDDAEDKEVKLEPASTLTITDGTERLVWAKTQDEIDAAVVAATSKAAGADGLNPGEMVEILGAELFGSMAGVVVDYAAASSDTAIATGSGSDRRMITVTPMAEGMAMVTVTATATSPSGATIVDQTKANVAQIMFPVDVVLQDLTFTVAGPDDMNLVEGGMGGMVTVTTNRAVTENTEVMLMRDGSSTASDDDYTLEPPLVTIMAGQMSGSTMVMATADDEMENAGSKAEMLTLFLVVDGMQMTDKSVSFYIWDAAVPALPVIAQLLLAAFLAVGGYRRYRRR